MNLERCLVSGDDGECPVGMGYKDWKVIHTYDLDGVIRNWGFWYADYEDSWELSNMTGLQLPKELM